MTEATSGLSAIRRQIMWNRLLAVVEEQAQTLLRTAFSPIVRESGDLSAGVFDLQGHMVAQAVTGTPGHVNSMAESVRHFIEAFPTQSMAEGDVYCTNNPWKGTGHLNDLVVTTPAFHRGRLVGLFSCTSHIVDLGGIGFGPDGTDVFMEGLYLPFLKLVDRGRVNETLMAIVKANTRLPVETEGDIYSLINCNEIGCRRLSEMMAEFGLSCAIAPRVPNNAGSLSAYGVTAPPHTIVNALPPAPVASRHLIGQMLPDVVFGCMRQAIPDRVPAEGTSCIYLMTFRSRDAEAERRFAISVVTNGGTGRVPARTGSRRRPIPAVSRARPSRSSRPPRRCSSGARSCVRIRAAPAPIAAAMGWSWKSRTAPPAPSRSWPPSTAPSLRRAAAMAAAPASAPISASRPRASGSRARGSRRSPLASAFCSTRPAAAESAILAGAMRRPQPAM